MTRRRMPARSGCFAKFGAGQADRQAIRRLRPASEAEGYIVRGSQIIDATIVSVPKQRNTKEENDHPSAGETRPTLPYQCNVLPPSLPIWRIQLPS